MDSKTFDNDSVSNIDTTFGTTANITLQSDIGTHFVELLKASGCSESLLPDSEYINEFFRKNEGEEFGEFLLSIGSQNIVTDEEISCAESVTESEEVIDAYLSSKLGDQTGKVPVTQECLNKFDNDCQKLIANLSHLESFKTYLESEINLSTNRLSSLKEAIKAINKENNDALQSIKCLLETCETNSAVYNQKMEEFFSKSNLAKSSEVPEELSKILAEIFSKVTDSTKIISEEFHTYGKNIKEILQTLSLLPRVESDVSIIHKHKEFLQMVTNWYDLGTKWYFINVQISLITQVDGIKMYMCHIIDNAKTGVELLDAELKNITLLQEHPTRKNEFDCVKNNIEKLNQILTGSQSSSIEELGESLANFDRTTIHYKNDMEKTMMKMNCALESGFDNLDKLLKTINNQSSCLSELVKDAENSRMNFIETKELINTIKNLEQKELPELNELLFLAIMDPEQFSVRLAEFEDKVKLYEKAVL